MPLEPALETVEGGKPWYTCPSGPMVLGEAPVYRASDSTLHWVDVLNPAPALHILSLDPETGDAVGEARVVLLADSVSVFTFRDPGEGYLCASYGSVAVMDEETGRLEIRAEGIPHGMRGERRFNDGGVDARGRFWVAEIDKLVCV